MKEKQREVLIMFRRFRKNKFYKPELEKIETVLVVDVLTGIQDIRIFSPFHVVHRVIVDLRFITNSIDFTLFGLDAALTNGISIEYNGRELFNMLSSNDLATFSYDVTVLSDGAVTKNNSIVMRYTFARFGDGLNLTGNRRLFLRILDDLSASTNTSLTFTFEGWYK